jgi:hypothetical protein
MKELNLNEMERKRQMVGVDYHAQLSDVQPDAMPLKFLAVGSQKSENSREFFGFSENLHIRQLPFCLGPIGTEYVLVVHQNHSGGTF